MNVQDRHTSQETSKSTSTVRLVAAGASVSGLVASDMFLSLFCSGWPLGIYLAAAGLGVWKAEKLQRRFSGNSIARRFAIGLAVFSACGLVFLTVLPVHWESKCAWRYCARAMGPGLGVSPFPVGTPDCRAWMTCANEAPFSPAQYQDLLRRVEDQGCEAP